MKNLVAIVTIALAMLTGSASAQVSSALPEAGVPVLIVPYDKKLMRLAEVLGSIHFLRELCKANEGQLWRNKMVALLKAEKPEAARKSQLTARFNRGFNAYRYTYRSCTPVALAAIDRHMKEGVRLTSQITSRYGR